MIFLTKSGPTSSYIVTRYPLFYKEKPHIAKDTDLAASGFQENSCSTDLCDPERLGTGAA